MRGTDYYLAHDAQGSIVGLTSGTGAIEATSTYDPFGNLRNITKVDPNAPTPPDRFRGPVPRLPPVSITLSYVRWIRRPGHSSPPIRSPKFDTAGNLCLPRCRRSTVCRCGTPAVKAGLAEAFSVTEGVAGVQYAVGTDGNCRSSNRRYVFRDQQLSRWDGAELRPGGRTCRSRHR